MVVTVDIQDSPSTAVGVVLLAYSAACVTLGFIFRLRFFRHRRWPWKGETSPHEIPEDDNDKKDGTKTKTKTILLPEKPKTTTTTTQRSLGLENDRKRWLHIPAIPKHVLEGIQAEIDDELLQDGVLTIKLKHVLVDHDRGTGVITVKPGVMRLHFRKEDNHLIFIIHDDKLLPSNFDTDKYGVIPSSRVSLEKYTTTKTKKIQKYQPEVVLRPSPRIELSSSS